MSNDKFQEVKAEILRRAEQKEACKSQYSRANDASTVDEMLSVVKDNFAWCWHRQVVDIDLLNKLGEDVLWRNGIYTSGEHHLEFSQDATLFLLGSSQATIETWGSSQATIETRESSIVHNLSTRKIYVPKSGWEIVEYEETEATETF